MFLHSGVLVMQHLRLARELSKRQATKSASKSLWKHLLPALVCTFTLTASFSPAAYCANPATTTEGTVSQTSGETTGVSDKEIFLGSCAALEGPVAGVGKQVVGGAKLYLDYVNTEGGINGRKIKLFSHDDSYDPEKAMTCFSCLETDKVFAGAFFLGAPPATKYVRLAATHKFPIVGFFSGAQMLYEPFRPYIIGIRASYYDEALAQVDHLWDVGFRKFAVIFQNDACGAATVEGVKRALKARNSSVVGLGSFERGSLEVGDAINSIKQNQPDVIVFDGTAPPIVKIIKACHESGLHPQFSSVSFLPIESFIKLAGKDAEGTIVTQVVPPYDDTQLPTVALYRKLLQKSATGQAPTFANFEGFIDALVVCDALKQAGRNLTRTAFIKAIESFHNKDIGLGPEFKLNFSASDHKGFDHVCYTMVHNGQMTIIKDWKTQVKPTAAK